jgi:hypothetical protein
VLVEEDVLRLDVAVDDAGATDLDEREADLLAQVPREFEITLRREGPSKTAAIASARQIRPDSRRRYRIACDDERARRRTLHAVPASSRASMRSSTVVRNAHPADRYVSTRAMARRRAWLRRSQVRRVVIRQRGGRLVVEDV